MTSRPERRDGGVTLVELLIAIAIMASAVAVIVGASMTALVGSDANHGQADISVALRAYADNVNTLPYSACPATYTPSYVPPAGYTVSLVAVEYWNPTSSTFTTTCPATDSGFERLTLRVAASDGRASETLQVEKRVQVTGQTP